MLTQFRKYQGTGNDFVVIDNRDGNVQLGQARIARICNRKFGIGADGLILLEYENGLSKMVYYNSDGADSSMCGNGARCFVQFCRTLGLIDTEGEFLAVDGLHEFRIEGDQIHVKMKDVTDIDRDASAWVIDTGSPHFIMEVDDLDRLDMIEAGTNVRYSEKYRAKGINVNFVSTGDLSASMRTYERGVESETLSCGTGATAVAVMLAESRNWTSPISISTLGGKLTVSLTKVGCHFKDVWLIGPAVEVFRGDIEL